MLLCIQVALSAMKIQTPVIIKNLVTVWQVIQMFVGAYFVFIANTNCQWHLTDTLGSVVATLMYASYIYLFTKMLFSNLKIKLL